MNSETTEQESWVTQDGSAWWLRSSTYGEETAENLDGDYQANCFLDLKENPEDADSVTFNDRACDYHSKSYYCQAFKVGLTPKSGSPEGCTCKKVELVGKYSAGELLKCESCIDVWKAQDKNSCPQGTKLFSPRSAEDWKTFIASATKLADPHWIIDVTRPQNGCGGCADFAMNSDVSAQATWITSDGSPWWLRDTSYEHPTGEDEYEANCFMDLSPQPGSAPATESSVTFIADKCEYHSASYYCQTSYSHDYETTTTVPPWDQIGRVIHTDPAEGSPAECHCEQVELCTDCEYSAGAIIKCTGCLRAGKTGDKNSCPDNTKLFAPQSHDDWKVFFDSGLQPLRAPNFIVDVTRPEDGCANCTDSGMNSANHLFHTWTTSDGAPWWLRSSTYSEPSGDYSANCYMDLFGPDEFGELPPNSTLTADNIMFSDSMCNYYSTDYYCQPKVV